MHDTSIRSYYSYKLISELAYAQKTGFLDTISTIIGVFASIATIVGVLQFPQYYAQIGYLAVAGLIVLVIVWIILRARYQGQEILEYGTNLAIVTDELLKYSVQVKLLGTCEDKEEDFAKAFLSQTIRAMRTSRKDFANIEKVLKNSDKYREVLQEYGWDEEKATQLLADIDKLIGES